MLERVAPFDQSPIPAERDYVLWLLTSPSPIENMVNVQRSRNEAHLATVSGEPQSPLPDVLPVGRPEILGICHPCEDLIYENPTSVGEKRLHLLGVSLPHSIENDSGQPATSKCDTPAEHGKR